MQGTIRCVLIAGLLLACHSGDIDSPDSMGSGGQSGLLLTWSSAPADLPANLDNSVTLERARFALDSLRVVGDAGPGDPRTTENGLTLCFNYGEGNCLEPAEVMFEEAPPGLYSQVALDFDGHLITNSFRVEGKVTVNSQVWDYRIEDDAPLAFNVGISTMANPGKTATVELRINFIHALDAVDWANMPVNEGRLELEGASSAMTQFRAKLVESFEVVNATGVR